MALHHAKSLHERGAMVLHRHSAIEVRAEREVGIVNLAFAMFCLLHHSDTPVHIGGKAVFHVVVNVLADVSVGIERLVADQHSVLETLPVKVLRRSETSLSYEFSCLVHDVGVTVDDAGEFLLAFYLLGNVSQSGVSCVDFKM